MDYCINPFCSQRKNPDHSEHCLACGNPLLINNRIRLKKPLRDLNVISNTEVFEVEDLGTKWNPVKQIRVIKILKWAEPKLVELIERESLALQLIDHGAVPNSTEDDYFTFSPDQTLLTLHCLVMEKFSGENLESWLEKNGAISQKVAFDWLRQLLDILDMVHRSTFFHRDIKPENIIIQNNNQLALIDFGAVQQITDNYLLRVSTNGGTNTALGTEYKTTAIATPGYSPLEQINGQAVPQSDFYALGKTFVRLVTGEHLINLNTDIKTGMLLWRKKAPQIDKPLADLIDSLMAPFPGDRPQNTQMILQRLNRLPLSSKINRLTKSKPFQISAFILTFLALFGIYKSSLPIVANYFFRQGKKAELENRFVDSQKKFAIAIRLNSNQTHPISKFYFDQASRNAENPSVAKKYYELSIKYNPTDVDAYNNLALVCQQLVDLNCAINNYKLALQLNSNNWPIHYNLGNFYDDQGKYDKAAQQYKLAIEKSKDTAVQAINNLSRLENLNGNYKAAQYLALKGLKKTERKHLQAPLYKNLGWALFQQKLYQQAIDNLQKALELDPQRTGAYCLLAQTQEKLNLVTDARLSWEVCLMLNSSLPEVQGWRQKVLQRIVIKKE